MQGLSFEVEGIYFLCFRKVSSTSVILSYPIPPFTTIRGFLANCLGMPRFPDYKAQLALQDIKIGMQAINLPQINKNKTTEMCKLLKLIEREAAPRPKIWASPSAPMYKEFLVNPKYKIYLVGNDDLLEKIYDKLQNPWRPLYLGQSDDLVDVLDLELMVVKKAKSKNVHSIIEGICEGCEVVKLPYKFSEDGEDLEELTVSIPEKYPLVLDTEVECYRFDASYVCVY